MSSKQNGWSSDSQLRGFVYTALNKAIINSGLERLNRQYG